jgi:glycosyltransferase involved in cell wall biosynthesis
MSSRPSTPLPPGSFSVLIPAYRAAGYIGPTLAAVAAQTLLPAEVLVYEDGRLDDLAARVAAFAATAPFPVRLLGSAQNQGVSRARNQLHAEAAGEYIAYLDADDLWTPDHLATAANAFAFGADVTFSGVTFVDAAGAVLPGRGEPGPAELADIPGALFRYNFVQCTSTLCLRRSWLDRVGDFDESLSHGEDLDLWLRLLAAGAVWRYTGRLSCAYRKHPASAMGQTRLATARLTAFYEKQLTRRLIPRDTTRAALIENLRVNARFAWRDDPAAACAALARLLQLDPWNLPARAAHLFTTLRAIRIRPTTT